MITGKIEMIRFFQPGFLGALLLAAFAGLLVPLYFEKPRFFVKQTQIQAQPQSKQQEDSARSVYDYKLANPDSNKFSEDWFELVSNDTVLEFLPSGFQKFRYGTSGLLEVPNLFVTIVPQGLDTLPVGDKKAIFIRFLLQLILLIII